MINNFNFDKRVKTLEKNLDTCLDIMYFAKIEKRKEKFLKAKKLKYHFINELEKLGVY